MRYFFLITMIIFSKISFAYCQPATSTYDFIATMNGIMKKEVLCKKKKVTIKSHILVDLWVYKVTYDETAKGEKNKFTGITSREYKVEDSRKDNVINFQVKNDVVDLQSVPYVLGYQLAKKTPVSKVLKVLSEEGVGTYTFQVLNMNEKINTPLGILETVKIQGKQENGDQLTYWIWKKNYSMVKEDIRRDNDSVFEATIASQSSDTGCCWA